MPSDRSAPGRLSVMSPAEAHEAQGRLVEQLMTSFSGGDFLGGMDLGLDGGASPSYTRRAESAIAAFFEAEDAVLLHGSGTAAVRESLAVSIAPGGAVLMHSAGPFRTTGPTLEAMGARVVRTALEDLEAVAEAARDCDAALLQHARHLPTDTYDIASAIDALRAANSRIRVVVDDNYAVLKVRRIGYQLGADLSAFSTFKLLGPEGVGCVVGRAELIDRIRARNASGGGVVQGPTARAVLEGLVAAPIKLAFSEQVAIEAAERIEGIPGVSRAFVGNLEETVIILVLEDPMAAEVIEAARARGAATRPVGTESRHELVPLIHQVSSFMVAAEPAAATTMVRVSPMFATADPVVRLVEGSLADARRARSDAART
ncbi:MAG TPA: aminotransferase class V-fold PLP-dependent enzyme [Candidatus Limnocylindrales bacterium]|nr:aminotransferase class V-fold PLP-dependent enzyme [Candidatus Limnocylindrales bacterium]